ncbi:MAG: hypothetical protein B6U94_06665 [Thermofilum sp. ex4484_79]|nr:MAG: hypothetical protein B6U94_06665 [Thermofilum sp. ex4484_79]
MSSRTTITILSKTKRALEALKKDESWDEFLLKLIAEIQRVRREKNRGKLSEILEAEFEEVKIKKWAREY